MCALPSKDLLHLSLQETESLRKKLPPETILYELAELYKLFADSTRVRILCVLQEGEFCVLDLSSLLGISQSALSHQLRILKQGKLVRARRAGKSIFYSLADKHVRSMFKQGLAHVQE